MKIAVHTADLDHERIDGTRVYMLNVLKKLGMLSPKNEFVLYHKKDFNSQLAPPQLPNYKEKKLADAPFWTQMRFAWQLHKDKPDVLWMPMSNIPFFKAKKLKTVVTIHDLAFKYFPEHFPKGDLRKLNFLADMAIKKSDKIIAISEATKKDILKFFPTVKEEKISVVYHGFDSQLFQQEISQTEAEKILATYNLKSETYLLYVGAIQPRKNLATLVDAFEKIHEKFPEMKLVIAGEKAWMWEPTVERINASSAKEKIIVTGKLNFEDLPILYRNARMFVFPSLYEGFGIPILEAFASGVPVVCASNSGLSEVAGEGALYFESGNSNELAMQMKKILSDEKLSNELVAKGKHRLENFSWEKCAQQTLDILTKW